MVGVVPTGRPIGKGGGGDVGELGFGALLLPSGIWACVDTWRPICGILYMVELKVRYGDGSILRADLGVSFLKGCFIQAFLHYM